MPISNRRARPLASLFAALALTACMPEGAPDEAARPDARPADSAFDAAWPLDADPRPDPTPPPEADAAPPRDAAPPPPPPRMPAEPPPPEPLSREATRAMAAVDAARYAAELAFVAQAPRSALDPHRDAVRDRCVEVFLEAGLEVRVEPLADGANVIGVLPGLDEGQSPVLIGAGIDTPAECPAAATRAAGTAALFEAARVLGGRRYAAPVVFACFDNWFEGAPKGRSGVHDYMARDTRLPLDNHTQGIVFGTLGHRDDRPGRQLLHGPASRPSAFRDAIMGRIDAAIEARAARADFLMHLGRLGQWRSADLFGPMRSAIAVVEGAPVVEGYDDVTAGSDNLTAYPLLEAGILWADFPIGLLTDTGHRRNPHHLCLLGPDSVERVDVEQALTAVRIAVAAATEMARPAEGPPTAGVRLPDAEYLPLQQLTCDPFVDADPACEEGTVCGPSASDLTVVCRRVFDRQVGLGERCSPPESIGCLPGLGCGVGVASPEPGRLACQPLCFDDDHCADGEFCIERSRLVVRGTRASVCAATCTPGEPCADGATCRPERRHGQASWTFTCLEDGDALEGEYGRCAAGLVEDRDVSRKMQLGCLATCRPGAGMCADDQVCRPLGRPGLSDDYGVCVAAALVE